MLMLFTSHQVGHSDMHEPKEVEALKLNNLNRSPKKSRHKDRRETHCAIFCAEAKLISTLHNYKGIF